MRRNDKAITDPGLLDEILNKAIICRLALCDDGVPYIVPLNFGYSDGYLHFHSATEGRKLEILKKSPRICFEIETDTEPDPGGTPCAWSMRYRTIIGYGVAEFVDDPGEKLASLNQIVKKFLGKDGFRFTVESMAKIVVFRVKITEMTGKQSRI